MYRSTRVRASFRSQGLPRELAVKFPFYFDGGLFGGTTLTERLVIVGNSLDPHPVVLQGSIATPVSSDLVTSGDVLVPGHDEYTSFYGTSLVTGSSWTLQFTNTNSATSYRVVVLVCPYQIGRIGNASQGQLTARVNELDALNFDDLAAQPYARVYFLNWVSSGHETKTFHVYRRTASMIGIKDLKDRITIAGEDLPLVSGANLPAEGWFVYVRPDASNDMGVAMAYTVRGVVYSHFTSRAPLAMPQVPAPPTP